MAGCRFRCDMADNNIDLCFAKEKKQMNVCQEEIDEVIKLLEHLKYMEAVRYSAKARLLVSDFEARLSSSNDHDYSFTGIEVRKFIERHIQDDINETVEKLEGYGVSITDSWEE